MKKCKKKNVLAGIVTFNPDIGRLGECLRAVSKQIDAIYIFDNGSDNIEQIENLLGHSFNRIDLHKNTVTAVIATALSCIMDYAHEKNYEWVLTMDQDSVLQPGVISAYLDGAKIYNDAGMFTCLIKDRNFVDEKYEKQKESYQKVQYCITSAAFTNVAAYKKTKGYDKEFFIDCVDFDICYSLIECGYQIYRVNHIGLLHEVGKGENRRFLWKKIVVYHEKPFRIFYLARNMKRMYKKHPQYNLFILLKKELSLLIKIILYEDEKMKKIKYFLNGIKEE
ncbi:MAG: glycosyltransferase [Clostridia bacterium]|nr:glycosyltransferase [Clostridia bacterium]